MIPIPRLFESAALRLAGTCQPDLPVPVISGEACLRRAADLPSFFVLDRTDGSEQAVFGRLKALTGASKIIRLSVFLTADGHLLFLMPAGPDDLVSEDEFLFCIRQSAAVLAALDIPCRIGLLSGGRLGDVGRSVRTDETIRRAQSLEKILTDEGFPTIHHTILIEDAVKVSTLLIAPDSLSGELIVRTAAGVGGGREIGSVLLFIPGAAAPDRTVFPFPGSLPLVVSALTGKADMDDISAFVRLLSASLRPAGPSDNRAAP